MGIAGIPQPKAGAVTKAHGGVLFIDEIGELHPIQMNKLLKVLEDRRVFFESAYYSSEDRNMPLHIQDIFDNGLPADFRLVGATTRQPHEIPPAIRSRCLEIFFRPLFAEEIAAIAQRAARKVKVDIDSRAVEVVQRYCTNGREAVNMVQVAAGLALTEQRRQVDAADVEWVAAVGQYTPRVDRRVHEAPAVGVVNGLAVYGPNLGTVIEIEAVARVAGEGRGRLVVTGVVDEEEMGAPGRTLRRKSMARGSVENVLTVLATARPECRPTACDVHLNFPGGVPLDGPSAGAAIAMALYSALTGTPVDNRLALTGELSIRGEVRPVGGVGVKIEAARRAGCSRVAIPRDNWQESFADIPGVTVVPVATLDDLLALAAVPAPEATGLPAPVADVLAASPSAPSSGA
jgi:Lon-like ATP-dependent protease